ncbi:MAG: ATP-binding protein [Phycisphaerae bacterium]
MAPRFSCPACLAADRKRLRQAQADSERAARERALAAVRADLPGALARCGVPEHWQAATLDNCPDLPAKLVEAARKWAAAPEGMVYLFGPPGAGKSWLAVAMLRAVLESGRLSPADCLYVGERSYLDRLRATFNGAHVSPRLLPANHPCRVALLLFDDLGASRLTDWGKGEIAGLIEGRHADGLPTICTSNLDPAQLAQAVDARVASRIAESGRMYVFPSRDFRIVGVLSKRARPGARIQNGE